MTFFQSPTHDDIQRISDELNLHCSGQELEAYEKLLIGNADTLNLLYSLPEPVPPVQYPRTPGHRPSAEENPYHAWYWKCSVKGESSGKLAGMKVAVKDHAFVAGVPMMNGSRALEGFVPEYDATIVTRMLQEGAEIVGKSIVPDLCCCGSSIMNPYGPTLNPWDTTRSAGGSSSGSAVLLAIGEVDLATGGDQGGSIRIPASCCGIVGIKPTFGLVPYTGVCPIETSLDHVIAGYDDDADSRQPSCGFSVPEYTVEMRKPPNALKIGILKEGFELCENNVQDCVRKAVEAIKNANLFSAVVEVSMPTHLYAKNVWNAFARFGMGAQLLEGGGYGIGAYGLQSSRLSEALQRGLKTNEHATSHLIKALHIWYTFVNQRYGKSIYSRGQSQLLSIRKQYDTLLKEYDVLIMPTLPQIPTKLPDKNTSILEAMVRSGNMVLNTAPFDSTHHPALSLNAGFVQGLPVGMQIVGRRWDDATVLRVAYHVEKALVPLQTEMIKKI
uniref:Amidase domain-containing protein n=1 Tax=Plectus sambesii TaxID=2011161 RepID=A0A914URT9_9BILA